MGLRTHRLGVSDDPSKMDPKEARHRAHGDNKELSVTAASLGYLKKTPIGDYKSHLRYLNRGEINKNNSPLNSASNVYKDFKRLAAQILLRTSNPGLSVFWERLCPTIDKLNHSLSRLGKA